VTPNTFVLPFAWEKASLAIGKYIPANVEPLAVFPVTFLLQLIRLVTLKSMRFKYIN
jgi:hypothetical protein